MAGNDASRNLELGLKNHFSSISGNWSSIAKALARNTERRVVAYDARNHGSSPHTDRMSYEDMAGDLVDLVRRDLGLDRVVLVGHSMGGRTMMLAAIRQVLYLEVDILMGSKNYTKFVMEIDTL